MTRKLLTAIDTQVTMATTAQITVTKQAQIEATAEQFAREHATKLAQTEGLRFLNVQRLTTIYNILEIARKIPLIPPPERREITTAILSTPLEEEILLTKRQIMLRQEQQQQIQRRETVRLEKRLQEVQERLLSPTAINLTDHTVLCMLDKLLMDTEPETVPLIIQQLLQMCEKKAKQIPIMVGKEALQKQLLQLYVPMFMTFPYGLNMLALRLSALTAQMLDEKWCQVYYCGAMQALALEQKYQLMCCEKRRLETKMIASGKPTLEYVPVKFKQHIWGYNILEKKVGVPKNIKGDELVFMILRYAYNIPYWIRRFVAIHMGLPENSKYYNYFHTSAIPTRRFRWKDDIRKYPEAKYLTFSRDKHVMKAIIKYQSRYGLYYPKRGKHPKHIRM